MRMKTTCYTRKLVLVWHVREFSSAGCNVHVRTHNNNNNNNMIRINDDDDDDDDDNNINKST